MKHLKTFEQYNFNHSDIQNEGFLDLFKSEETKKAEKESKEKAPQIASKGKFSVEEAEEYYKWMNSENSDMKTLPINRVRSYSSAKFGYKLRPYKYHGDGKLEFLKGELNEYMVGNDWDRSIYDSYKINNRGLIQQFLVTEGNKSNIIGDVNIGDKYVIYVPKEYLDKYSPKAGESSFSAATGSGLR